MPLEFQWDVDGEGHRETIAYVGRRRLPRWVLRLGRWLLIGVSVLTATAYGVPSRRPRLHRDSWHRCTTTPARASRSPHGLAQVGCCPLLATLL